MRIKHLARLNPSKSECNGFAGDRLVSFIPMESIGTRGHIDATRTKAFEEVRDGYTYVAEGDVLLAKITPCFENGKCAVAVGLTGSIGFATTEVIPLRTALGGDARFLYYLLTSEPFRSKAIAEMYGAGGQKRVPERFVWEYQAELPQADQRRAIVAFLDGETARIDTLIAKQKQLIELLKEKRRAVISQAVTKGLDPDVPMKDSGVEWLGEVPAHWSVCRLLDLVSDARQIMYGIVLPGPNVDNGVPIVKGGDVKPGRLQLDMLAKTTFDIEENYVRSRLLPGDLVYSIRGTIGDVQIVPEELSGANLTQDAARISPKSSVDRDWLVLALESRPIFGQLEIGSLGATIRGINIRDLKKARIPTPPEAEQHAIKVQMSEVLRAMGEISEKATRGVKLLRERRSALISAAVTGQIDVTTYAPSGTTAAPPA